MLPLFVISHQKTSSSSHSKWQNKWVYIVLALLKRARFISASLITLRSLYRYMMNDMSGSMGSGDLLSQKFVVKPSFWRSHVRVGHFAPHAI
jgi:hypothetical protein